MSDSYTHVNLTRDVEDSAPKFGFGDYQEARFANEALATEQAGLSLHRVKPGRRQGFGHRHERTEEIYVVLSGSGRIKLDDEVVEISERDAIRVSPGVARAFEADDAGLEVIACGPRDDSDRGEILPGWWE